VLGLGPFRRRKNPFLTVATPQHEMAGEIAVAGQDLAGFRSGIGRRGSYACSRTAQEFQLGLRFGSQASFFEGIE